MTAKRNLYFPILIRYDPACPRYGTISRDGSYGSTVMIRSFSYSRSATSGWRAGTWVQILYMIYYTFLACSRVKLMNFSAESIVSISIVMVLPCWYSSIACVYLLARVAREIFCDSIVMVRVSPCWITLYRRLIWEPKLRDVSVIVDIRIRVIYTAIISLHEINQLFYTVFLHFILLVSPSWFGAYWIHSSSASITEGLWVSWVSG